MRGDVRAVRREHRGEQVLGRGLAGRARDRHAPRAPSARRHARARRRAQRAGRRRRARRPRARPRRAAGVLRPTSTPHAPAASASAAKRPPSTCSPGSPTNRSPGPASRESIDRALRARRTARAGGDQPRARRLRRRAQATRRARSASRATVDVVERHLAAARELLPLLVALAGDHDDVAASARAPTARSIAARRSSSDLGASGALDPGDDLGDDRLAGPPSAGCRR